MAITPEPIIFDFHGKTELSRISFFGQDLKRAKELIEKNKRLVNVRGSCYGDTPLINAVTGGAASLDYIKMLIENGADHEVLLGIKQQNIHHLAANAGRADLIEYFYENKLGPDINGLTTLGETPLHAVCMQGMRAATIEKRKQVIEVLLKLGVSPDIKNIDGKTAAEVSKEQGLEEIGLFLTDKVQSKNSTPSFDKLAKNDSLAERIKTEDTEDLQVNNSAKVVLKT